MAVTALPGSDFSGNNNHWTVNNITVSPTSSSYDVMVDSPVNVFTSATDTGGVVSGNYPTMSTLVPQTNSSLTDGNLTWYCQYGVGNGYAKPATFWGPGKWYFEVTVSNGSATSVMNTGGIGVMVYDPAVTYAGRSIGYGSNDFVWRYDGYKVNNNTATAYGTAVNANTDVVMCAWDTSNNTVWFGKNGTWFGSSDPATATSPAFTDTARSQLEYLFKPIVHSVHGGSGTAVNVVNFGQRPFAYAPPSGFKSLNTTNMQAQGTTAVGKAGLQPNKWFDINVWGGTGYQMDIVNAGGFAPDLVWEKCLSTTYPHLIVDSVRGAPSRLIPNTTAVEADEPTNILKLNSNGFTVGTNAVSNNNGYRNVGWQWKQSPSAGFNIITWTGTGTAQAISHNLGVSPDVIICKARDAAQYWIYHHKSMSGIGYNTYFNTVDPQQNDNQFTAKSSSTITVSGGSANGAGVKYVGYLFAEVPGFSKFGLYAGSGVTDGPFIYLGFRPKYVKIKSFSPGAISRDYLIYDSVRTPYNGYSTSDFASGAQSITTSVPYTGSSSYSDAIEFMSNGFKIKNAGSPNYNGSGESYAFMAFAESPFALNNRAR